MINNGAKSLPVCVRRHILGPIPIFLWVAIAGVLAVAATPAQAVVTHPLIKTFGSVNQPSGIAIDESSPITKGNVLITAGGYTTDNVIDIFGPTGEHPAGVASPYMVKGFEFRNESTGLEVDNSQTSPSKGDLYVTDVKHNEVKKFQRNPLTEEYELVESLKAAGGFGEPLGLAINSNGDVYVANYSPPAIIEFDPAGVETGRINLPGAPAGLAFDSPTELFVQSYGGGHVAKLTLDGAGQVAGEEAIAEGATGLAVDPSTNSLYLGFHNHVTEYGPATATKPEPEGEFSGGGVLGSTERIAINAETHDIYVTDAGVGDVAIFGPKVIAPNFVTSPVSGITRTGAVLHGQVEPDSVHSGGPVTECHFEYGTTTSYSSGAVPCSPNPGSNPPTSNFNTATNVIAELSALQPNTLYHYRIVAADAVGANGSEDGSFRTAPGAPIVSGESVTNVRSDVATLHGQINPDDNQATYANPNDGEATYHVEYVDEAEFQESEWATAISSPVPDINIGFGGVNVSIERILSGLIPGTKYHFRVVAQTPIGGTADGADQTFTTLSTGTGADPCPNAHVRQQTSTSQLPDCRAFELASAANTGGYEVESDLVEGQTPFAGYPAASGAPPGPSASSTPFITAAFLVPVIRPTKVRIPMWRPVVRMAGAPATSASLPRGRHRRCPSRPPSWKRIRASIPSPSVAKVSAVPVSPTAPPVSRSTFLAENSFRV